MNKEELINYLKAVDLQISSVRRNPVRSTFQLILMDHPPAKNRWEQRMDDYLHNLDTFIYSTHKDLVDSLIYVLNAELNQINNQYPLHYMPKFAYVNYLNGTEKVVCMGEQHKPYYRCIRIEPVSPSPDVSAMP